MTNDVSQMKDALFAIRKYVVNPSNVTCANSSNKFTNGQEQNQSTPKNESSHAGFKIGQRVVNLKNEDQMKVKEFTVEGTIICTKAGTDIVAGEFSPTEIADFNEYWGKQKGR